MAEFRNTDVDILNVDIDTEFERALPEMSEDELSQLERNIIADGEIRDPFIVWNGTMIDGHHRLKIMKAHPEIDFRYTVKQADFADKYEALAWIIGNNIGRRNLSDIQRSYLIGQYYDDAKITQGGDRRSENFTHKAETDSRSNSRQKIAEKLDVSVWHVRCAYDFKQGVDTAETVCPGFTADVLSGNIIAPQNMISDIRNVRADVLEEVVKTISKIRRGNTPEENNRLQNRAKNLMENQNANLPADGIEKSGVIYVLTNKSFPDYVKIGYTNDVGRRLAELNRSECIPFPFRVYATYKVTHGLTDKELHNIIDIINPNLRAVDTFDGKPRVKEFFMMSPEDAYSILESIAAIDGRKDKLQKYKTEEDN